MGPALAANTRSFAALRMTAYAAKFTTHHVKIPMTAPVMQVEGVPARSALTPRPETSPRCSGARLPRPLIRIAAEVGEAGKGARHDQAATVVEDARGSFARWRNASSSFRMIRIT